MCVCVCVRERERERESEKERERERILKYNHNQLEHALIVNHGALKEGAVPAGPLKSKGPFSCTLIP